MCGACGHMIQPYMFFKYDEMVKLRLRRYNSRRVVRVSDLSEDLTAQKVLDAEKSADPCAIYGRGTTINSW